MLGECLRQCERKVKHTDSCGAGAALSEAGGQRAQLSHPLCLYIRHRMIQTMCSAQIRRRNKVLDK